MRFNPYNGICWSQHLIAKPRIILNQSLSGKNKQNTAYNKCLLTDGVLAKYICCIKNNYYEKDN